MTEYSKLRCTWLGDDEMMIRYHDEEWGVPVHDDLIWFEFIVLDAFQAGLSCKKSATAKRIVRNCFVSYQSILYT